MSADDQTASDHAAIVQTWLRGWAAARKLGRPAAQGEGWRVEVGWPQQRRRHVFPRLGDELRALGESIVEPWVFLKCCTTADALRAALPARWTVQARSSLMTFDGAL